MDDASTRALEERGLARLAAVPKCLRGTVFWLSAESFGRFFAEHFDAFSARSPGFLANHVGGSFSLTRKDLMAENLQRLARVAAKRQLPKGCPRVEEFLPKTVVLTPGGEAVVESAFRDPEQLLIVKPAGAAQGRGIFVKTAKEVVAWTRNEYPREIQRIREEFPEEKDRYRQIRVVSAYVDAPLLLGDRKFDFRVYVALVGQNVYLSGLGFGRFCAELYGSEERAARLTNVAINHLKVDT